MFRFFALGFLKVLFFHKSKIFFVKLIFVFFHIFLIPTVHKHLSKGSNEQTTVFFKVYSGGQSVCMCVWVFFFVFNPSTKFGGRNTQFVITDNKVFREAFHFFC